MTSFTPALRRRCDRRYVDTELRRVVNDDVIAGQSILVLLYEIRQIGEPTSSSPSMQNFTLIGSDPAVLIQLPPPGWRKTSGLVVRRPAANDHPVLDVGSNGPVCRA